MNFPQADFVGGEIAKTEGRRDKIKGTVFEGEPQSVRLDIPDWTELRQSFAVQPRAFLPRADEHAVRKVHASYVRPISAVQCNGQVARSTTKIEYLSLPVEKDWSKKLCSAGAPEAVELKRQKMIEQVVARRNLREHFPYFFGSIGFGNGAFGACSLSRRGGLSHGGLVNAWHWR